jgi:hypothetical protein
MRFDDSSELFGSEAGMATPLPITCHICGTSYNSDRDTDDDMGGLESVLHTNFCGLTVCDCCFEQVENEIFSRMPHILRWYRKILVTYRERINSDLEMLNAPRKTGAGPDAARSEIYVYRRISSASNPRS